MKRLSCVICSLVVLSLNVLLPLVSQGEELDSLLQKARTSASAGAFRESLEKVSEAQTLSKSSDDISQERHPVWDTFLDVYIELKQDETVLLELRPQVLALVEQIGVQDGQQGVFCMTSEKIMKKKGNMTSCCNAISEPGTLKSCLKMKTLMCMRCTASAHCMRNNANMTRP